MKRELENTSIEDINRGRDRAIWDAEKEQSTSSARTIIDLTGPINTWYGSKEWGPETAPRGYPLCSSSEKGWRSFIKKSGLQSCIYTLLFGVNV